MTPFVHLHLHTSYSLAEGAIRPGRLAELCRAHGMPAAAATDTDNLFGALEIAETLAAAGVQPIPGLQQRFAVATLDGAEARGRPAPHLVFLARSEAGFRNLTALTSRAFLKSARDDGPCADLGWLDALADDLLCLTGGRDGPIDRLLRADRPEAAAALLERLADRFGDRLYVELQRLEGDDWGASEPALLDMAYAKGLPVVATNEPFFPTPEDHEAHDALLCIADGAYVHQDDRRRASPDQYFMSGAEMAERFADLPEAIAATVEAARRCAFRPRTRQPILPRFVSDAGDPPAAERAEADELRRQARAGLEARLAATPPAAERAAYEDRLERELSIIVDMGFAGYFLIVADFIQWAKRQGIAVGPGRGSGAGSLVAWALTVTDLDPLRFGLLFERFLNPERVSMPDFDIDFCQERRDEVLHYVQERYGADRVAQIITFGKLQARAVLRDVGRVLGLPFGQVDRLCKLVPNNPANPTTLAEAVEGEPRLREERDRDETVAALLATALKLEGLYRHASTHAAGVVIADRPLQELAPLYLDPRAPMPATQYNMKWVEPAGLVKFDFLGLKTLTVLQRAAALAAADGAPVDLEAIPLDDPATFAMLGEGASVGVFQLESAGMRQTLRAMRPDSLEDVIALISLYRPGPMENIPAYIERKQGLAAPDFLHPALEPVLRETYGVIIYQEQVMRIAQILSGYSLGEADLLRRAMGKKKKDEMDRQRRRFVDGAAAKGVDKAKASSIFDLVQKFAGYGFNKSHAAAYAVIAYRTAFMKANRGAAFLAASMSLDRANVDKLAMFVAEARRMGVAVRAPDVNASDVDFTVADGAVVYGLSALRNGGEGAMATIVEARRRGGPFVDLHDFAERADLKAVGKRALESLALSGALDGLAPSRAVALANIDRLIRLSAAAVEARSSAQVGLFDAGAAETALERPPLEPADPQTPIEALEGERAAIGFYFSGHPLDAYGETLEAMGARRFADLEAEIRRAEADGAETRIVADVAAVVRSVRRRRARSGAPFAWIGVSDATGDYEVTAFSEVLDRAGGLFETGAMALLRVAAEAREGAVRFTVEAARPLDAAAAPRHSRLTVRVDNPGALPVLRRRLEALAAETGGGARSDVTLRLALSGPPGGAADLRLPVAICASPAARGALLAIEGVTAVEAA